MAAPVSMKIKAQTANVVDISDIGVLCSKRDDVERVRDVLSAAAIETVLLQAGHADDRSLSGVRITTMHRAKGLVFTAVAIPYLSEGGFPPAGAAVDAADKADIIDQHRSLLHVAATRAKRSLRVSWSGKPTNLIPALKESAT